jgi:hypothetical protein
VEICVEAGFAAIQTVMTPIGSVDTIYPVIGDLVGQVALVVSFGLFAGLLCKPGRRMRTVNIESATA